MRIQKIILQKITTLLFLILINMFLYNHLYALEQKNNFNVGEFEKKINRIEDKIEYLSNQVKENTISKSFFSSEITIFTTIVSLIFLVAIFFGGYFIPMLSKKKYEEEITKIKEEFKEIKKEIKKNNLNHLLNNSQTMMFLCNDLKAYSGVLYWAVKCARISTDLEKIDNTAKGAIAFYLKKVIVEFNKENIKKSSLGENIDDLNSSLDYISSNSDNETIKKMVTDLKTKVNKIYWS